MTKPLNQKTRVSLEQHCRLKAIEALDGVSFTGQKEHLKAVVKVTNALLEVALTEAQ